METNEIIRKFLDKEKENDYHFISRDELVHKLVHIFVTNTNIEYFDMTFDINDNKYLVISTLPNIKKMASNYINKINPFYGLEDESYFIIEDNSFINLNDIDILNFRNELKEMYPCVRDELDGYERSKKLTLTSVN